MFFVVFVYFKLVFTRYFRGAKTMQIRLMKKADIPHVSQLFVDSYAIETKNMRWSYSNALKYVNIMYRLGKDLSFVALEGNQIVACSITCIIPQYLEEVASSKVLLVHPKYRKQKIRYQAY